MKYARSGVDVVPERESSVGPRGNFFEVAWEIACGFVGIYGNFWGSRGNLRVDSWEFLWAACGFVGICVWIRGKITCTN